MKATLRFGLVLVLATQLAGCATLSGLLAGAFNKPTLTFKTLHFQDVSFEDMTLDFEFEVDNPNNVALEFATLDYALDFDGKQLLKGNSDHGVSLAANGKSPLRVPLNIKFTDFVDNLALFFSSKDEVPYSLAAGFGLKTPVGVIRLPANIDGVVPLPKPPKVAVNNVAVKNVGFTGADIEFDVSLENQGKFPLQMKELLYAVEIAGARISDGQQALTTLGPASESSIKIPLKLNFISLGAAVVNAVRTKKLPYKVGGAVDLGVFKQPFNLQGTADL